MRHLGTDDLYDLAHQAVFELIRELALHCDEAEVDYQVFLQEMREAGIFRNDDHDLALLTFWSDVIEEREHGPNVEYLSEKIADYSRRRQLLKLALDMQLQAEDLSKRVPEIMHMAETGLSLIAGAGATAEKSPNDYKAATLCEMEDGPSSNSGMLSTGFADLDHLMGYLSPGAMVVIAARPSIGKTTLLLNIMRKLAAVDKVPCGLLSVEMPTADLWRNLIGAETGVPPVKIRRGEVPAADVEQARAHLTRVGDIPLHIEDCQGMTIDQIRAKAQYLHINEKIGIFGLDYIQLVEGSSEMMKDNALKRVTRISQTIKIMARAMQIPVIAISQLNRASDRDNRRPKLAELRESGAIEQDADIVLLLYREEGKDTEVEVNVAKNRNGQTGKVTLHWTPHLMRFGNAEHGRPLYDNAAVG